MKASYDFSKARENPYAKSLKRPVTIRLDVPTIDYFKALGVEADLPYQTLINLFLRDCASQRRKLRLGWPASPRADAAKGEARAVRRTSAKPGSKPR